eukprot:CAMPEP_0119071656 /NCGR_PEP_ID=MMETSP1178-20130426/52757_1 /TAXON_ID=33656 /ORGANISM="unid sp, Strain CCMP2000" /LENGTH=194 /DNA_ID=CAMNT_0007053595 /DNA_START=18 /DNA_END=602 /DNA_ORIENTATION=-
MATLLAFSLGLLPAGLTRRDALVAVASAPALLARPALTPAASSAVKDIETVKILASKAKALRATVRSGAAGRRQLPLDPTPGYNNYASTTDAVKRAKQKTLLPLQAAMAASASSAVGLPDELQKSLALQPLLMKGHLLELDQALAEFKFEEYTSKTTGSTYPGGKVERELEEVCETAEDFINLAFGRAVEQRKD